MTDPAIEKQLEHLPLKEPSSALDQRISALCGARARPGRTWRLMGWRGAALAAGVLVGLACWSILVNGVAPPRPDDPAPVAQQPATDTTPLSPANAGTDPVLNEPSTDEPDEPAAAGLTMQNGAAAPPVEAALRIEQTSVRLINDGLIVFDDRPPAYRIRRQIDRRIWWNDSAGQPRLELITPTEQVLLVQAPVY